METIYRDYSPKGVRFIYLYKALAHPELEGYVKPVTLEERLMHIKEARRTLGSKITWVCDAMDNRLKHSIGNAPNSEYVLDPEGRIVSMRVWSKPAELRADLAKLVGTVEPATTVAELDMKVKPAPKTAPTGIVPRVRQPGRMSALKVEPQLEKSRYPFYVKLRAEADRELLQDGEGELYLGFHLDPLYHVHWNNLVAPVQYEFFPANGVTISPAKGEGPKVEAEADADPREFLLDVERGESAEPVRMKFRYFACDEKMCMPVTQEYLVSWDVDPDGGRPRRPGAQRPAQRPGGQAEPPGGMDPQRMVDRMMQRDANGDGKLSKEELPAQMQGRFDRMDGDGDGFVTADEVKGMMERRRSEAPGGPQR